MRLFTIRLLKTKIDEDIDHRTFKRMEVSLQGTPEVSKDAAASDTEEDHDAVIVTRYRDYRDAKLRKRLVRYLTNEIPSSEFADILRSPRPEYVYTFSLPDDTRTELMAALKDMMHEYIVRGTIYDWYKYAGLQPTDSEASLEDMENDILNSLRGKPVTTRPLQPFGPPFPHTPLF